MIVPMHKYSFLVYHADYDQFIADLKQLGLVHIIESDAELTESVQEKFRTLHELNKSIQFLQNFSGEFEPEAVDIPSQGPSALELLRNIQTQLDYLIQQQVTVEKEIKQLEPWGYFNWESIDALKEAGLDLHFFTCPSSKFSSLWTEAYPIQIIHQGKTTCCFVLVHDAAQPLPDLDADEIRLPQVSLIQLESQLKQLKTDITRNKARLKFLSLNAIPVLENYRGQLSDQLSDEQARLHTSNEADDHVKLIEGWAPETELAPLNEYLEREKVLHLCEKANHTHTPPVLLKNNRFSRLFEFIGNLYSLPNYSELDLTPWFAPFYLLFFGFCFSDAGYGLLVLSTATIVKWRSSKSNPILSLLQLLGGSTVLFGLLGGTFFGIDLYQSGLPVYSSLSDYLSHSGVTIQDIMFKASLGLGLIQILFGMFLKAAKTIKQSGFRFAISTFGWVFLIIFSGINYLLSSNYMFNFWNPIFLILGSICSIGILFMNSPGKSLILNFGIGLWDTYNTLVGGVGDLLSYVRLFALGLASGILGSVFNDLGLRLLSSDAGIGYQIVGFLGMLLILLVGHAINIFMSGLGSMVHPLRLTFVEFYKNAGFEGGGRPYQPFKSQTINN